MKKSKLQNKWQKISNEPGWKPVSQKRFEEIKAAKEREKKKPGSQLGSAIPISMGSNKLPIAWVLDTKHFSAPLFISTSMARSFRKKKLSECCVPLRRPVEIR